MERFVKGDIVVIPFPFSDLSGTKRRPAYVLSEIDNDDVVLCQITSQGFRDNNAIKLSDEDFLIGSLNKISFLRPAKIFTANHSIILKKIGVLNAKTITKINQSIKKVLDL